MVAEGSYFLSSTKQQYLKRLFNSKSCRMSAAAIGLVIVLSVAISTSLPLNLPSSDTETTRKPFERSECKPLVIAHRGASGYVPEHTLGSYALAITLGADYVEPDLVITKDGYLIARHDNVLDLTTDVADHLDFAHRRRNQTVDGIEESGWFTEDFTLEEIKKLRAKERIPNIRPGNARLDGSLSIPTFQEIIDLVQGMENSQKRVIGIYPEIKHSTHFSKIGLPLERKVVDTLHRNGYRGAEAPAYIQSFEVDNLKQLKDMTQVKLLQLFDSKELQPFDQTVRGTGLTYGDMATAEGLKEVGKYAYAVGPDKGYIIPRDADNTLGNATYFVENAHMAGLKVHPYTFRAENVFLPKEFRSDDESEEGRGDLAGEIKAYLEAGIDGLFSDQPDIPARIRGPCL